MRKNKAKTKKRKVKSNRAISETTFINLVDKLVKRHGKVRILSSDGEEQNLCDCLCKKCERSRLEEVDMRMRQIDKKGECKVSYNSEGYSNWSGFSRSCFMDEYFDQAHHCSNDNDGDCYWSCKCEEKEVKPTVKQTVEYMLDHDRGDIFPTRIEYGKKYKRKMKVKLKSSY